VSGPMVPEVTNFGERTGSYTLCINGCQFKIPLYAFKLTQLTSFESKNSFELSTQNEVSWANFNTYKIIFISIN